MGKVRETKPFTPKQGQYPAFIYYCTKIHGRPPAEADFQRFLRVTPSVVHEMIKTLTARGFIDSSRIRESFCDTLIPDRSQIVDSKYGEMSEWLKEHAWKAIRASIIKRHRNTSWRIRFNGLR